jgi:hypothetical protein
MSFKKEDYNLANGELIPLIPKLGGGLSMEVYLWVNSKNKYIVRKCNSNKKAMSYGVFQKNYLSIKSSQN